ncbi:uncharacterized protein [Nicotiana tomentosiformis]|uniref:uncharacterized protein n=1 Tax=Nicotiana tomentosiformis TaxID=4098 RepID=UPI00388CE85E
MYVGVPAGFEEPEEVLIKPSIALETKRRQNIASLPRGFRSYETRYPYLEKLALALVVAARKLRPYFQCHPIAVVTTFPLQNIHHNPELSGRLPKWAVEMSEFDIEYKPRTVIKSQVLADFIADFSLGLLPLATKEAVMVSKSTSLVWTLFTDGASNVKRSGLRKVLITPSGETLRQVIRTILLTNNEAEYEALIAGLELAQGLDSEVIEIKCDSQLVVNLVYGIFDTKEERMQQYVIKVQALLARFREWSITHIPREDNTEADALANLGSSTEIKGSESETVVQLMSSVLDTDSYYEVNSSSLVWDWRNEIINYLEHENLPDNPKVSRALCTKAAHYSFRKGQLHRKSFQGLLARFRIPKEIACDNGPQFIGAKVTKFFEDLKIKRITSSPYHPSANGQAESTNKVIIQNLKKSVETLIPVEVSKPTLRYSQTNEESNGKAMLINLELLVGHRDLAHVRMATQK